MKRLLGILRRTTTDYEMIKDGDRVAVGISGKDSITLLYALHLYQKFSPVKFDLEAMTIDLGFPGLDLQPVQDFCRENNITYTVKKTDIAKIVFETRQESNPCSLCANMRRGALHNYMKERGLNVLALGHHADDAVETFLMNLLYTGRIATFAPKTFLTRKEVWVIRPFIFAWEKEIMHACRKYNLPIIVSPCPVDKKTNRENMKQLVKNLIRENSDAKINIMTAMRNKDKFDLRF
ncbi:MAG: tRNA 2-thiocytidine biosynthesis TtcA family protein [Zhaonellaceae bacterium]|nr:tRNA 2-thiocytidine biosynthesis protein TtcA [Clostridia bacterium]